MKSFLLRYSQIANCKVEKTITALALETDISANKLQQLAYDQGGLNLELYPKEKLSEIFQGVIYRYKVGQIDDRQFVGEINNLLGVNLSEEQFARCWNKQCELEEENTGLIKKIEDLQGQYDFKLYVVGNTNAMNHRYIQTQLNEKLLNLDIEYYLSFKYNEFDPNVEVLLSSDVIDLRDKSDILIEITNHTKVAEMSVSTHPKEKPKLAM